MGVVFRISFYIMSFVVLAFLSIFFFPMIFNLLICMWWDCVTWLWHWSFEVEFVLLLPSGERSGRSHYKTLLFVFSAECSTRNLKDRLISFSSLVGKSFLEMHFDASYMFLLVYNAQLVVPVEVIVPPIRLAFLPEDYLIFMIKYMMWRPLKRWDIAQKASGCLL